ncbi:LysE family translocator [Kineococcus gynurae]|uniref:LysE family translocator n=1 Tax=Kineococcus gynurae TaxID=452979 RepID=A0ABV5LN06_9ACTN
MVTLEQVVALALASALLIVVPGLSVLFVVGRALSRGRRVALAGVVGNGIGSYAAAVAIAVGLGPVLHRSELVFLLLKVAGAAYLVWLGVHAIRHPSPPPGVTGGPRESTLGAVRTGAVVGISNPKVFILFAAILPPFADPTAGDVTTQLLLLALVPVLLGLTTDSLWGLLAGRARGLLAGTPARSRTVARVGGGSMIALGVSVALTGRPGH